MAFGVYIHIPYCIQRCHYCDFTTFEKNRILPPKEYTTLITNEIHSKHLLAPTKKIDTIYFGGGTPSLIDAHFIVAILHALANAGFERSPNCEVTIEINPATVDEQKLQTYLDNGINRFSIGAQTFNDQLLQICGREHSSQQTKDTLSLFKSYGLNYSFDLLFALPQQNINQLHYDLEVVHQFAPQHLSAYCLTVPQGHSMSSNRPLENEQIQMFRLIEQSLKDIGLNKYELSNFAKPNSESRHNLLYWQDQPYLSFGVSAHSYTKNTPWGERFWNTSNLKEYTTQNQSPPRIDHLDSWPSNQQETLECHEALTDFCHTSLRLTKGLQVKDAQNKFGTKLINVIQPKLQELENQGLLLQKSDSWALTSAGQDLSNVVFQQLTFVSSDLP